MTINTAYLGTPGSGNAQSSLATTVFSELSVSGPVSVGALAASTGAFSGTVTVSDDQFLSVNTVADATGLSVGQLTLVFMTSGVSLVYSSGDSYYVVNSALSAAQA